MIKLRSAREKDREFLRRLRNSAVSGAILGKHCIGKAEHRRWWDSLNERGERVYIIGVPQRVGAIRVLTHYHNEVGINLMPEFRGRGIGQKALDLLPKGKYISLISMDNIGSLAFFSKCGFKIKDKVMVMEGMG